MTRTLFRPEVYVVTRTRLSFMYSRRVVCVPRGLIVK